MKVMAIDPGTTESAFVLLDLDGHVLNHNKQSNDFVLGWVQAAFDRRVGNPIEHLVIEQVASYGMPVGREVFETVHWAGRFHQAALDFGFRASVTRLTRKTVAEHLCGGGEREKGKTPNDATVRKALLDRYGGDEARKKGGALHGITNDRWAALAVGCAYLDGVR